MLTVAATAAVLCTAGYMLGSKVSGRPEIRRNPWRAVLIGLGCKILAEHRSG